MKFNWKKMGQGLGLVWLATGIPAAYFGRPLDPMREFGLQAPVLPEPNGYTKLLALSKWPDRGDDKHPVDEIYISTGTAYAPKPSVPAARRQQWVERNQLYFHKLRRALQLPVTFPLPDSPVDENDFDHYTVRNTARFLAIESHAYTVAGQHEKAAASLLDAWEAGLKLQQGAPMVGMLHAMALEAMARGELSPAIAYLNGPQAARAAMRLERLLPMRPSLEQTWQNEKYFRLLTFKRAKEVEIYRAKRSKENLARIERGEPSYYWSDDSHDAPAIQNPVLNWKVRNMSRAFARRMDGLIATAGGTWKNHAAPPTPIPDPQRMNPLIESLGKSRFFHTLAQAQGNLMLGRLALHACRKDSGAYPSSLSQLVPRYLQQVPQDPFNDGQPLRYTNSGSRYKLWSIGPDGRDDIATPVQSQNYSGEIVHTVKVDSTGDIVAGINDAVPPKYRIVPGGGASPSSATKRSSTQVGNGTPGSPLPPATKAKAPSRHPLAGHKSLASRNAGGPL